MKLWEWTGMFAATAFGVLLLTAGLLPALAGAVTVSLCAVVAAVLP